jgi:DNA-binding response OmpR family regulator
MKTTTVQRVIKMAFKDEAIRVITVPRGRDAFGQIEADVPDIVLADNGRRWRRSSRAVRRCRTFPWCC